MRYEKEKLAMWCCTPTEHMLFNIMEALEKVIEILQKDNVQPSQIVPEAVKEDITADTKAEIKAVASTEVKIKRRRKKVT